MADLEENTNELLNNLPDDVPVWGQALISLIKLMLGELRTISKLNDKVAVNSTVVNNLKQENTTLKGRITDLEIRVDENEQHDRNINLLLKGVAEDKDEDTTGKFVNTLNKFLPQTKSMKPEEIKRSHRLGKFNPRAKHPRPIIARFDKEVRKIEIFREKKVLKGKGVTLSENLTARRKDIYNAACNLLGYKNVWSLEGRIFGISDNQKILFRSKFDIPGYTENT